MTRGEFDESYRNSCRYRCSIAVSEYSESRSRCSSQAWERVSRHYYDLHCLLASDIGRTALAQPTLGLDCVRHARMFLDRPDYDLASAAPGSFAITPIDGMIDALKRDYGNMTAMIFGAAPDFAEILASINEIELIANLATPSLE